MRSTYYAGIRRCLNEWDLIWFNIVIKMNSDIILLCRLYNHSTWTSQKHSRHLDQIISNSDTARSRSMIIRELFVRSTYYAGIRRCLNEWDLIWSLNHRQNNRVHSARKKVGVGGAAACNYHRSIISTDICIIYSTYITNYIVVTHSIFFYK